MLYQLFSGKRHRKIPSSFRHGRRHRFRQAAIWSVPVTIVILIIGTSLNPIYDFIIAGMIGALTTAYCRRDLVLKMIVSAGLFFALYYLYFLTLIFLYPGYVEAVWNFGSISGVLVTGIPIEELFFAVTFGLYWSSLYEHYARRSFQKVKTPEVRGF